MVAVNVVGTEAQPQSSMTVAGMTHGVHFRQAIVTSSGLSPVVMLINASTSGQSSVNGVAVGSMLRMISVTSLQ